MAHFRVNFAGADVQPAGQRPNTRLHLVRLLPHLLGLCVDRVLDVDGVVHVKLRRAAATAVCPSCERRSRRIHTRYTRRLTDEPIGRPLLIHLLVRRCPKRTFAEQAARLAARYARWTVPLRTTLQEIGLARLGGRPGARLSARLHRHVKSRHDRPGGAFDSRGPPGGRSCQAGGRTAPRQIIIGRHYSRAGATHSTAVEVARQTSVHHVRLSWIAAAG